VQEQEQEERLLVVVMEDDLGSTKVSREETVKMPERRSLSLGTSRQPSYSVIFSISTTSRRCNDTVTEGDLSLVRCAQLGGARQQAS
jgi:hypothetical protein